MPRSPRAVASILAAVVAVALIAGGIALGTGGDSPVLQSESAPPAPAAVDDGGASQADAPAKAKKSPLSGPALPDVRATSTDGTIDFASLKGPALIHVYASWCSVCQGEAADLGRALKDVPGVKPVWIAVQDEPSASAAFVKQYDWPAGPRIDDANRSLAGQLGLTGQPNTILVDAEGNTRTFAGAVPRPTLIAMLRAIS
jgi:thiol-disulfide isomerase/thioredoxin